MRLFPRPKSRIRQGPPVCSFLLAGVFLAISNNVVMSLQPLSCNVIWFWILTKLLENFSWKVYESSNAGFIWRIIKVVHSFFLNVQPKTPILITIYFSPFLGIDFEPRHVQTSIEIRWLLLLLLRSKVILFTRVKSFYQVMLFSRH